MTLSRRLPHVLHASICAFLVLCVFTLYLLWQVAAPLPACSSAEAADEGELVLVESKVEAVIEIKGDNAELASRFPLLEQWIEKQRVQPMTPNMAVFLDDIRKTAKSARRAQARRSVNVDGRNVPRGEPGAQNGRMERAAPVLVLATVHEGPHSTIDTAYKRLLDGIGSRAVRAVGPFREVYLRGAPLSEEPGCRTDVQVVVEPTSMVDIGIYADLGAFRCVEAGAGCFIAGGFRVRPVSAAEINDGSFAKKVRALFFTGWGAGEYCTDITPKGAHAIEKFIADGGGYLGLTGGADFAAAQYMHKGKSMTGRLKLFPGTPIGPIEGLDSKSIVIEVLSDHPIALKVRELWKSNTRTVFYTQGPALKSEGGAVTNIARVAKTGEAVIAAFEKGKGRVFLSGVHLEFNPKSERYFTPWWEYESMTPDDPDSDWELLQLAARWVLGKL